MGGASGAPENGRVLVVDDEAGIRTMLSVALSVEGYVVDLADDGHAAWEKARTQRYSAFLVDLRMPKMTGEELYRRIYSLDKHMASRMIFITGDIVAHDSHDFIKSTGNPIITKPFALEQVYHQLRSLTHTGG